MYMKGIRQWLNKLFNKSCGIDDFVIDDNAPISKEWQENYNDYFIQPLMLTYGYSNVELIMPTDIADFIKLWNQSKLKGWIFVLKEVYEGFTFDGSAPKDIVRKLAGDFLSKTTAYCVGSARGTDFIRYAKHNDTKLIGLDTRPVVCIGPAKKYKVYGVNTLKELAKEDPWELDDYAISALRDSCNILHGADRLNPNFLKSFEHPILDDNNNEIVRKVSAYDPELPSEEVRRTISSLSDSCAGHYYKSAYEYIVKYPDEYTADTVKDAQLKLKDMQSGEPKAAPNDSNSVLAYINEHYGTEFASLDDVIYPSKDDPAVKKQYGLYVCDEDDSMNKTIADVVNHDNDGEMYGTFDELITQYCAENEVSLDCTINQLLDALNTGILCTPKTFLDHLTEYCETTPIDSETTVDELLQGIAHKPINEEEVTINFLENCTHLSDAVKAAVITAIRDKQYFDIPSKKAIISDYITSLDALPDELVQSIYNNVNSGTAIKFTMPVDSKSSSDKAYVVSDYIARHMRDILNTGADTKRREGGVPIVYAYLRILMAPSCKESDFKDLVPMLEDKQKQCSPEFAKILDGALEILRHD